MNTAYFYLTEEGEALVKALAARHPGDIYPKEHFKEHLQKAFVTYDSLVCVMAAGIVVRILAPLIEHKTSDPAVVVLDQKGQYVISLLSGHLGGANDLARELAAICGGEAVITTATDVAGELSFDTFAKAHHMAIENIGQLKFISSALLSGQKVRVFTDNNVEAAYPELKKEQERGKLDILPLPSLLECVPDTVSQPVDEDHFAGRPEDILSNENTKMRKEDSPIVVIDEGFSFPDSCPPSAPVLYLRPRTICAGIGCKRNMDQASIEAALLQTLKKEGIHPLSLQCIATIPLKSNEPGIIGTASRLRVPLKIIPTEDIKALDITDLGIASSEFVAQQTGVPSVSTACSYLASGSGQILRDKVKYKGITIALSKTTV